MYRTYKISKFVSRIYAVKTLTGLLCFKISSSEGLLMVINIWFSQTPALLRRPEGLRSLEIFSQFKLNYILIFCVILFLYFFKLFISTQVFLGFLMSINKC